MIQWQCPVCQQPLASTDKPWRCSANHSFDCAKEGYTHLLLANQKRRAEPGDNSTMMRARRTFLGAGFYAPLADALSSSIAQHTAEGALLDLGCGEGYYTAALASALPHWQLAGVDISREAVRLAAKRGLDRCEFAVASSRRLPLAGDQFQAVTCVFAPLDSAEVQRVLAPAGRLWRVAPGPRHLMALKRCIYDTPREHAAPAAPLGFTCLSQQRIQTTLTFDAVEQLEQLLAMTPFSYRLSPSRRAQLLSELPPVEADFYLSVYAPSAAESPCPGGVDG